MASAPSIKAGEPTEFTENPELWHLQDLKKDPSGHLSQPVNLHVVEPPQLTQQFAKEKGPVWFFDADLPAVVSSVSSAWKQPFVGEESAY